MSKCKHLENAVTAKVVRTYENSPYGVTYSVLLQVHCTLCGTQYLFKGVPRSETLHVTDFSVLSISPDGLQVLVPMEPNDIMTTTEPMGMLAGVGKA